MIEQGREEQGREERGPSMERAGQGDRVLIFQG